MSSLDIALLISVLNVGLVIYLVIGRRVARSSLPAALAQARHVYPVASTRASPRQQIANQNALIRRLYRTTVIVWPYYAYETHAARTLNRRLRTLSGRIDDTTYALHLELTQGQQKTKKKDDPTP